MTRTAQHESQPHRRGAAASGAADLSPTDLARVVGLRLPTDEQAQVIAAPLSAGLVQAGAGSGKTETMAARVVWLVATGRVSPEHVLGLTFTRKAAAELAQRLRQRLAHARDGLARTGLIDQARHHQLRDAEPVVLTYHSYAAALLSEHAARGGIEPHSRLAGEAACWQIASRVVHSWPGPLEQLGMSATTLTATVLRLSAELGEHLTDATRVDSATRVLTGHAATLPRDADRSTDPGAPYADVLRALGRQEMRLRLLPLVEAYERAKREAELIDYGDQVSLAARLAREHPDIARAERARYRVVLLDEYQDTSQAQDVLLRSLFADGHPVTAVGDPVQAIYGWRGASAGAMSRFQRDYARPDGAPPATFHLSRSFRNGSAILRLANAVSEGLRSDGPPLTSGVDHPGTVRCALHPTAEDEARWIAWHASDLIAVRCRATRDCRTGTEEVHTATHPSGSARGPGAGRGQRALRAARHPRGGRRRSDSARAGLSGGQRRAHPPPGGTPMALGGTRPGRPGPPGP